MVAACGDAGGMDEIEESWMSVGSTGRGVQQHPRNMFVMLVHADTRLRLNCFRLRLWRVIHDVVMARTSASPTQQMYRIGMNSRENASPASTSG